MNIYCFANGEYEERSRLYSKTSSTFISNLGYLSL